MYVSSIPGGTFTLTGKKGPIVFKQEEPSVKASCYRVVTDKEKGCWHEEQTASCFMTDNHAIHFRVHISNQFSDGLMCLDDTSQRKRNCREMQELSRVIGNQYH